MSLHPRIAAYLGLQGLLILAWWAGLYASLDFRAHFLPPGMPDAQLMAFGLPDLGLAAAGSLACAVGLLRGLRWALPLLWVLAGAMSYATLYCLALSLLTGGAWAASTLMLPAMLLTLGSAFLHTRSSAAHAPDRRSA